jgi:hypothetical protein
MPVLFGSTFANKIREMSNKFSFFFEVKVTLAAKRLILFGQGRI